MNDCQSLENYLDGELTPEERIAFELHLESCWACRTETEVEQNLDQRIQSAWAELKAPTDVSDVPARCVKKPSTGTVPANVATPQSGVRWLAMAAAVSALILSATWYFAPEKRPDERFATVKTGEKPSNGAPVPQASARRKVVFVENEARPRSLILVPQTQGSEGFTIVKAYPTIPLTKPDLFNSRRTLDEQAN